MKCYDEYKQTGTPWIGEIPSHWEVKRLRFICSYKKGKNPRCLTFDKEDGMMPYLSMEYLRGSESNIQYTKLEDGLVEVSKNDMLLLWDGSNAGEFIISRDGVLSSTCAKLMVKELDDLFFKYYCFSIEKYLKDMTNGMGIPHVDSNVLKNILVFIPSLAEQEAIAAYLDKKCGSIDAVISTQERRIALLEELKQSVITEAVTHGINPDAKLRPSGIDWIGNIPEHWQCRRLRFICEFRNGYTPSKANPDFWTDGTIPWYRMEDIRDSGRRLNEAKQYVTKEAVKGGGLFEAGSFILATTATIGEHAVLIVDSLANQRFTNLKIRKSLSEEVDNEFFFYYLFVIDEYCKSTTKTATFAAVNIDDLKNFAVTIPSYNEQLQIVEYIKHKTSSIDASIAKAKREIELLRELKQSVITEAVTGKIKVC